MGELNRRHQMAGGAITLSLAGVISQGAGENPCRFSLLLKKRSALGTMEDKIWIEFQGGPLDGKQELILFDDAHVLFNPLAVIGHPEGEYWPQLGAIADFTMRWHPLKEKTP